VEKVDVDIREALGYVLKYGYLAHRINTTLEDVDKMLEEVRIALPQVGGADDRQDAVLEIKFHRKIRAPKYMRYIPLLCGCSIGGKFLEKVTVRQLPAGNYADTYGNVELLIEGTRGSPYVYIAWLNRYVDARDVLVLSLIGEDEWRRILDATSHVQPVNSILGRLYDYVEIVWDVTRGVEPSERYGREILEEAPKPAEEVVEYLRASMDVIEMLANADDAYFRDVEDAIDGICGKTFQLFPMERDLAECVLEKRRIDREVHLPRFLPGVGEFKSLDSVALHRTDVHLYFRGEEGKQLRFWLVKGSNVSLCRLLAASLVLTSKDWEWMIGKALRHLNLAVYTRDVVRRLYVALALTT
jgi:hypothetical protein